jgi:AraC-like DNA-binding protein
MRSSPIPSRAETRDAHLEQVMRALVHAEGHLGADLTLGALARVGHVSEFHFQRVFRRIMGDSPSAYVRKLRLDRAAHQLLVAGRPIPAIAQACGYRELASFYRAFRARFGQTPAAFRERGARARRLRVDLPRGLRVWINDPLASSRSSASPSCAASTEAGARRTISGRWPTSRRGANLRRTSCS